MEYDVYKSGGFQYNMKYLLANVRNEVHTTHLQLMQLAITSLTSLFAALITVDGTSRDRGHQGMVKQLVMMTKMPYDT